MAAVTNQDLSWRNELFALSCKTIANANRCKVGCRVGEEGKARGTHASVVSVSGRVARSRCYTGQYRQSRFYGESGRVDLADVAGASVARVGNASRDQDGRDARLGDGQGVF